MRTVAAVDLEIAATEKLLRELHAERRQSLRSFRDEIVADFDKGKTIAEIADGRALTYCKVQGILFRAGRTLAGRNKLRAIVRRHCVAPQVTA